MKESTELFSAGFATVNAFVLAKADGKLDGNDIQLALPLIFDWQAAIKDLIFYQEASKATPATIESMFDTAAQKLTAVTGDARYALVSTVKAGYIAYWSVVTSAFKAGQKSILAELKVSSAQSVLKAYETL